MSYSTIMVEKQGRKLVITLNRPERLNAMNITMHEELYQAWQGFRDDPELWVAIVTGAGERAFSAGADLQAAAQARLEGKPHPRPAANIPPGGLAKGMYIWKPIIAAINGFAVGGGLELALACDIRIAADHAQLGLGEVRWSLLPAGGGMSRLPRQVPHAVAMKMILTGQRITAQQALQWGLVTDVAPLSGLMPLAHSIADTILENAPLAVQAAKECVTRGLDMPLDGALGVEEWYTRPLVGTEDYREGPIAFAQKRKPNFKAR